MGSSVKNRHQENFCPSSLYSKKKEIIFDEMKDSNHNIKYCSGYHAKRQWNYSREQYTEFLYPCKGPEIRQERWTSCGGSGCVGGGGRGSGGGGRGGQRLYKEEEPNFVSNKVL